MAHTVQIEDIITQRAVGDVQISPDSRQVVFSQGWASNIGTYPDADLWLAATDGTALRRLTTGESHDVQPRWSPDGSLIAFLSDRHSRGVAFDPERGPSGAVYLISPDGGEAVCLSNTELRLRDPQWSPDGRTISVIGADPQTEDERRRMRERDDVQVNGGEPKYDRLYLLDVPADLLSRTPAGGSEPRLALDGQWHVWEQRWSPDGTHLAVTVSARPGLDELFSRIRVGILAPDGTLRLVDGPTGVYRSAESLNWSPDGTRLAFLGGFDLAHDNGAAVFVAHASDPPAAELRFQDDTGSLLSVGWLDDETLLMERVVGTHVGVWSLPVEGGEPQEVLPAPLQGRGTTGGLFAYSVRGMLDRAKERFALAWGDTTHPPEVWAGELNGSGAARQLTHFNDDLRTRCLGKHELTTWQAGDGLEIQGQIIYPVDYEPGRMYPTIVNIHGGPTWVWDDHFYANWYDWGQLLAGRGYLVFLPNPRGSTGRGWRFQNANTGDWMGAEYRDSQAGVDALIARGLADPDRLGIGGWSYGGYTTAWAVTQTVRYKAAIVLNGVTNRTSALNTNDNASRNEACFITSFAEDPDEYWRRSPLRYVGGVMTPTLFLAGERELRVPASQAWEMHNALKRMGVPTEIAVYPREPHYILERNHQRDLLERMLAWYDRYVKG